MVRKLLKIISKFFKFIDQEVKFLEKKFSNNINTKESLQIGRVPIFIGNLVVGIILGSFVIWASFAKIESAAIAQGKIVLDSNKKKIQHFEGGIIEEILVSDGQMVKKDQPLIRLSETSARANQDMLKSQLFSFKAQRIRLEGERDDKLSVDFAPISRQENLSPDISRVLQGEQQLFLIRKKSLDEKVDILQQKIKQLENEIVASESQSIAVSKRIKILTEEVTSLDKLHKEGIVPRSRYLDVEKQLAELQGSRGFYRANISKLQQAISESELNIVNIKTEHLNEVVKELQDVQAKITDLEERISVSSDIVNRTIIAAPQSGIINGLKFHTKGGVIEAGDEVMEIIPQDDSLVAEVKVSPNDIDSIANGLNAKVRLSAYKSKEVPLLSAKVINVSADSFQDQITGLSYFSTKIKINQEDLAKLKNVKLYPGMPIEAYIVTGSRTFFQYLLDPIAIGITKSFREE
jgi:HlyD family type I secretion membrane fusion protein